MKAFNQLKLQSRDYSLKNPYLAGIYASTGSSSVIQLKMVCKPGDGAELLQGQLF